MPGPRKRRKTPTFAGSERAGAKLRHGAKNKVRMPVSQLLLRVREQDAETARWARDGLLTASVMGLGDLEHLRALANMGASFETLRWGDPDRMREWSADTTRQWLTVLFDHGWKGHGSTPEVLLSVAEHHPDLLALWHTRAPQAWQSRHTWLQGALVLHAGMEGKEAVAHLSLGATPARGDRLRLDLWIAQSKEDEASQMLRAIAAFLHQDKRRRRVRGEPPFQDWPWDPTLKAALDHGRMGVVETLVELRGPLAADQTMHLVCKSEDPIAALDQVRRRGWKLPAAGSKHAGRFLSLALTRHALHPNRQQVQSDREALALHLLEEGYGGSLEPAALSYLNSKDASDLLKASYQHRQLECASQPQAVFAVRPRQRL